MESCSIEYGIEWPDHRPTLLTAKTKRGVRFRLVVTGGSGA